MKKNISIILMFTVMFAIFSLFASTEAIAAGDCSSSYSLPDGHCWDFNNGFELWAAEDNGTIVNGLQVWHVNTKKAKRSPANQLMFAVDAGVRIVRVTSGELEHDTISQLLPPGVMDGTTYFGGSPHVQIVRMANFQVGLHEAIFYTTPVQFTATTQIAVKAGSGTDIEVGSLQLPATGPQEVEQTVWMDRAADGSAFYVEYTRAGDLIQALCCSPGTGDDPSTYCFNFPTNFYDCTNQVVEMQDIYFGIVGHPTDFPYNATLSFDGGPSLRIHAGQNEHVDIHCTFQLGNRTRCKHLSNCTYRCY